VRDIRKQWRIGAQSRKLLEQQRALAVFAEGDRGKLLEVPVLCD
jgi:hypothetical protein